MPDNKNPELQDSFVASVHENLGVTETGPSIPLESREYAQSMLRLEVATYINQMSAELAIMARNSEMPLLSYFLDMAAAEARSADGQLRQALNVGADPDSRSSLPQA